MVCRKSQDDQQCLDVLRGKSLPGSLDNSTVCISLVHGLRYHLPFASRPDVVRFCKQNAAKHPEFTRARNARLIMSGEIPEMEGSPDHYPYCIWHPDIAAEDTYRRLAKRYPSMRYQVGRACAVAGYVSLYSELQLLPDVTIAEEARDSNKDAAQRIYESIIAAPVRYKVMDDYTRRIHAVAPRAGVFLNGDTATRASLDKRVSLKRFPRSSPWQYFDITEDGLIDEVDRDQIPEMFSPDQAKLLYTPLPLDLPSVDKDLLILMAAYTGNVDRYARLQRPMMLGVSELACVVRGIYHNSMFAKWMSLDLDAHPDRYDRDLEADIKRAINARHIMNNELSRIDENTPSNEIPYLIWWPLLPRADSLAALALRRPSMKLQIAHACIVADLVTIYEKLDVTPHLFLWRAAQKSPNKFYRKDLKKRAAQQHIDLERAGECDVPGAHMLAYMSAMFPHDHESTTNQLITRFSAAWLTASDSGTYCDWDVNAASVELCVLAPDELKRRIDLLCEGCADIFVGTTDWMDEDISHLM